MQKSLYSKIVNILIQKKVNYNAICFYNRFLCNFSSNIGNNNSDFDDSSIEYNEEFRSNNKNFNNSSRRREYNGGFKKYGDGGFNGENRNNRRYNDNYSGYNNQLENRNYNDSYNQRRNINYRNNDNFDRYQHKGPMTDADTIWGKRYFRNGYLDSYIHHKTHKLFEIFNNINDNSTSEEKNLIYDDEVFKDLAVYLNNKPVQFKEEIGKSISDINSIDNYEFHDIIKQNLKKMKINKIAPIQHRVLSLTNTDKDVIGCAQTGSGKTLAFLLPMIDKMLKEGPPEYKEEFMHEHLIKGMSYPTSLIITPTRELANQIYDECLKLCYNTGIVPVVLFGGEKKDIQNQHVERGADIVIATPGRLIDFLNTNLKLKFVNTLVLDEADMMLDLGFEEQLHQIMGSYDLPHKSKRKNLFFSATFEKEIISIANDFLNEYYFIGNINKAFTLNKRIEQSFTYIEGERISTLIEYINNHKDSKIIVFTNSKEDCKNISNILTKNGINTSQIHGDFDQNQRMRMLNNFKSGKSNILCATDVASRGLDISNVDLIINYEVPQSIDSYVHRIGRTGRKGKDGKVITFLSNLSKFVIVREIKYLLQKENIDISPDLETCLQKCDKKSKSYRGNSNNNRDSNVNGRSDRGFSNRNRNNSFYSEDKNGYNH